MIKGIDIGYTYTKDESKNIFKSAFTKDDSIGATTYKLEYNNQIYYVGDGRGTVELDKTETELNKLCLLTNLAISNANEFYVVTGLPIGQYKQQKDKLKQFLLQENKYHINLNDKEVCVRINDVMIFPQGAGALFSQNIEGNVLIVDIGGRTIDVALMEIQNGKHKLQNNHTWFNGMLVLYSKIIDAVNRRFELTLEPRYAEQILTRGLYIFGEKQDIGFLQDVLQSHFEEMFQEIWLNYPYKTTPIYLCGGGASMLFNAFKKRFPDVSMFDNSQFANAIGFHKVGVSAFGKYEVERSTLTWQIPRSV